MLAVVEELTGIGGHRLCRGAAALRTSNDRGKLDRHSKPVNLCRALLGSAVETLSKFYLRKEVLHHL
jgi:hypothetical protein